MRTVFPRRSSHASTSVRALSLLVLASCAASAAVYWPLSASSQINQTIGYEYNQSDFSQSVALRHDLRGLEFGPVSMSFDQSIVHDAKQAKFESYMLNTSLTHKSGIGGNFGMTYSGDWGTSGSVNHSINAPYGVTIALDASGNIDWRLGTEGDKLRQQNPNLDESQYSHEQLSAPAWLRTHSINAGATVSTEAKKLGPIQVKPSTTFRLSDNDSGENKFALSGGLGLSLVPKEEAEQSYDTSYLSFSHGGGTYNASNGEVWLAAGRDESGLNRLGALAFKSFKLGEKFKLNIEALGTADVGKAPVTSTSFYNPHMTVEDKKDEADFRYAESSARVSLSFQPIESLNLEANAQVQHFAEQSPTYMLGSSASFSKYRIFSPTGRLDISFSDGKYSGNAALGATGTLFDKVAYTVEAAPTFAQDEGLQDVTLSAGLTLTAPPLVVEGPDSEFSITGNTSLMSENRSLQVSGRFHF